ncbi:MAG: hypothetical protein HQ500_08285 [Flavobacteriales bacterium]|nr:hypothetical protein [Flavobacteriales bacterium]
MINIFRKLRQRLLSENKFTRYLLYSIGEIVLVVIGILIALQINNWNQGRLNANKEEVYLENLERDLENQLISIDLQLEYEQKYITLGTVILDNYYASDVIAFDSTLSASLSVLTERKTFVRTDPTFEDMLSTGNIGLLRNNGIRNALIEYYQELERVEKVLQNNNTLHTDQGYGNEITDLVFAGPTATDRLVNISIELLKEPEREMKFVNLVVKRTHIAVNHVRFMTDLRAKTSEILERLR